MLLWLKMASHSSRWLFIILSLYLVLGVPGVNGGGIALSDWQGTLAPLLEPLTLLDIVLPGTHDALTADSADVVSEDANDLPPMIAELLHEVGDVFGIGDYMRNQSITQGLLIPEQLDAGIRFIDFRITYTQGPDGQTWDWYGLHMVQTKKPALFYLRDIRAWLDAHPREFVVLWFSRHGTACGSDYPGADTAAMQQFWQDVEQTFAGLQWDRRVDQVNVSTLGEVLGRGHRVLTYLSAPDVALFSSDSTLAYDGCNIDNELGQSDTSWNSTIARLQNASRRREEDKANGQFFLMSMAGSAPGLQQFLSGLITFFPESADLVAGECAESLGVPGMNQWCPMHLLDIAMLTNYYLQKALDQASLDGPAAIEFPNAIYLNAVDHGGLIRTGTGLFGPSFNASVSSPAHATTGYAYVPTLLLYNVRYSCLRDSSISVNPLCAQLEEQLQEMRSLHPVVEWTDLYHGRTLFNK